MQNGRMGNSHRSLLVLEALLLQFDLPAVLHELAGLTPERGAAIAASAAADAVSPAHIATRANLQRDTYGSDQYADDQGRA